jgi:SAM-dependent methyltransferase
MRNPWGDGSAYERYMGRWSRPVAAQFVRWLAVPDDGAWLDVGCGSGALSQTVLASARPRLVVGCDQSSAYTTFAASQTADRRARFVVAELPDLPRTDDGFDAVVAGLVLNFLPAPLDGLRAMAARARRGGIVAVYVWDYAEGMQWLRVFWDAAGALDPSTRPLDEGVQFPLCRPAPLRQLFERAGLSDVQVEALTVPSVFRDFGDYWEPFLGGQGPAPAYVAGLPAEGQARLRDLIQSRLPLASDGTIHLTARVWAAKGRASESPPA